jgi:hypothetical protein
MDKELKSKLAVFDAEPINQIAIKYGTFTLGEICQRLVDAETELAALKARIEKLERVAVAARNLMSETNSKKIAWSTPLWVPLMQVADALDALDKEAGDGS